MNLSALPLERAKAGAHWSNSVGSRRSNWLGCATLLGGFQSNPMLHMAMDLSRLTEFGVVKWLMCSVCVPCPRARHTGGKARIIRALSEIECQRY